MHLTNVCIKTITLREALLTLAALARLLFRVDHRMIFETGFGHKVLSAHFADMRFYIHVPLHMDVGTFLAGRFIIRIFLDHVTLQVTFLAQCRITYRTLHWFARVNPRFVNSQTSVLREFLVAVLALSRSNVRTVCFVYVQEMAAHEKLVATGTFWKQ